MSKVIDLVKCGADVNGKNNAGQSALQFAALGGYTEICLALIESGAQVNTFSLKRYTPLHMACANEAESEDTTNTVALLIGHKANVNAKNISGMTALHIAARNGHKKTCLLLINHSAGINARDLEGKTPLKWAAMSSQMDTALLLIAHGAHQKDGPKKIRNFKISELMPWQAAIKGALMTEVGQFLDRAFEVDHGKNDLAKSMASYAKKAKQMDVLAIIQSRIALEAISAMQALDITASSASDRAPVLLCEPKKS